jgi:CheY-like chemotaxis protein
MRPDLDTDDLLRRSGQAIALAAELKNRHRAAREAFRSARDNDLVLFSRRACILEASLQAANDQASEKISILVVEDEVLIRMNLADELRLKGFVVIEACNAQEALLALQFRAVDLLLTDVRLGDGMDGVALATQARAHVPQIRVIIVSGHLQPIEAAGVADLFVAKPYRAEHIADLACDLTGTCRTL